MTGPSGLQFDKVEGGASMTCVMCKSTITDAYYHLNGRPICTSCKAKADAQIADLKARGASPGAMSKAVIYGLGAAIAGAIVYFAVAAITGLEIGIVAIVIGYMVGWSMHKATGGVGGRRYQVIAVAFTYLAVAMAYAALGVRELAKDARVSPSKAHASAVAGDSATAADTGAREDSALIAKDGTISGGPRSGGIGAGAILGILGLMLALPVMAVFSSGVGGILSAVIIGVGLRQAWRMTAGAEFKINGPFKIGAAPRAAST